MGKATALKLKDIPTTRRGRSVQLDSEMISDLKRLAAGKVQAMNLAPYFEGKDLNDVKVRQAIGQNIRKNWKHENGVGKDSTLLRLDFSEGCIAARLRNQGEPESDITVVDGVATPTV